MEASDLFWMVPAYIGGGLLAVYVAACNGRLTEAEEDGSPEYFPTVITFLVWPLLAAIGSLLLVGEIPMWIARKGDKKYQQKKLLKDRLKKLMAEEEKNKQEALRLLEEELEASTREVGAVKRVPGCAPNDTLFQRWNGKGWDYCRVNEDRHLVLVYPVTEEVKT